VSSKSPKLTLKEIEKAFATGPFAETPILTVERLCLLTGLKPKTIYRWKAKGVFEGTYRRRGKYILFWRDRVVVALFNGPDVNLPA
jgi:hypothetical protein